MIEKDYWEYRAGVIKELDSNINQNWQLIDDFVFTEERAVLDRHLWYATIITEILEKRHPGRYRFACLGCKHGKEVGVCHAVWCVDWIPF